MIAFLPLLIAAAPVGGDNVAVTRPVTRLASASVTIIQAEPITFAQVELRTPTPDRLVRQRDAKPLVEFY